MLFQNRIKIVLDTRNFHEKVSKLFSRPKRTDKNLFRIAMTANVMRFAKRRFANRATFFGFARSSCGAFTHRRHMHFICRHCCVLQILLCVFVTFVLWTPMHTAPITAAARDKSTHEKRDCAAFKLSRRHVCESEFCLTDAIVSFVKSGCENLIGLMIDIKMVSVLNFRKIAL